MALRLFVANGSFTCLKSLANLLFHVSCSCNSWLCNLMTNHHPSECIPQQHQLNWPTWSNSGLNGKSYHRVSLLKSSWADTPQPLPVLRSCAGHYKNYTSFKHDILACICTCHTGYWSCVSDILASTYTCQTKLFK